MNILVPVKYVVDYNIRVHVKPDGSGVETAQLKHSMNPFDEIALEQAIRLKEAGKAEQVIAVTIGNAKAAEVLRHAYALGADKAVHVQTDAAIEPLAAAKILGACFKKYEAKLALMGKQAIDDDYNQTGQMLAAFLDLPQATFISSLELDGDALTIMREVDSGLVQAKLSLPAVLTVDLRLNEPRYPTLPNIMKAKSKPIEAMDIAEFGVNLEPKLKLTKFEQPETKRETKQLAKVEELVELIKTKVAAR